MNTFVSVTGVATSWAPSLLSVHTTYVFPVTGSTFRLPQLPVRNWKPVWVARPSTFAG
jgi:hypothetical protein